jgi:hypothetical protein
MQLSDRRQRESLHLLQTLLDLEREERVALQEDVAQLKRLVDTGKAETIRQAAVKLLDLLVAVSGVDAQTLAVRLPSSEPESNPSNAQNVC